MSYTGPEFESPQPRRPRRGPLTVALAALVPGALLGWGAYAALGDGGSDSAAHTASRTASSAPAPAASRGDDGKVSGSPSAPSGGSGALQGKVVVIDPGHNPGNFRHTAEINRQVDIGTNSKECDTTGTSTNDGYTEASFSLDLAHRLRDLLEREGVTVKLTHDGDSPPWGPCVDERARFGNAAHADAAISLHADGSDAGNRGFHVILPGSVHAGAADTRPIVGPSHELGVRVAGTYLRATGEPPANYVGGGTGLVTRTDLGGLNLSTVPKVFIECGNMRDNTDAALLTSGSWRQRAAQGISEGIVSFLRVS
ncbi:MULTISPECIES: N-acetylmuramoyl-L-alanine amidase [Streptomyces]|uniref:N-acetylmuramoyl-L-alanine amidase n=1 Tax=Streptomyces TaxID=1883 RepID=UPI001672D893|nr:MULTISPECIES: N-acetylmuramoyl-L-alanine amidase [Streptomyces]MBK3522914.1 N-acetylmuramoyl-L-alanine amidase [Streptomyces sp. MBT70]GGS11778.1 N-acetylmuramoyl-L-alanine amidase [Streptomyces eurythermus]